MKTPVKHRLLITLGSNYEGERILPLALSRLREQIDVLAVSTLITTSPVDFPYPSGNFLNQTLLAESGFSQEDCLKLLDDLELEYGRTPALRRQHPERIPLDADLVQWDTELLKPLDFQRPYLRLGLAELGLTALLLDRK